MFGGENKQDYRKHKQYVPTQQLGMLPKGGPEDHDGSFASLRAEFTSESLALLEAAVSGARYEAVTRRRPAMAILANHDAASATGNSGGEAASGGDGNADGADAERDGENGVVMSWEELVTNNRSLSDFEKATWLELKTLCKSGVRDEIDVAIEVVIAKLENPLLVQKMWEWVKSGHKEIYDAIEMHRVITGRNTPEPVDDKSNGNAADRSSGEEEGEKTAILSKRS